MYICTCGSLGGARWRINGHHSPSASESFSVPHLKFLLCLILSSSSDQFSSSSKPPMLMLPSCLSLPPLQPVSSQQNGGSWIVCLPSPPDLPALPLLNLSAHADSSESVPAKPWMVNPVTPPRITSQLHHGSSLPLLHQGLSSLWLHQASSSLKLCLG